MLGAIRDVDKNVRAWAEDATGHQFQGDRLCANSPGLQLALMHAMVRRAEGLKPCPGYCSHPEHNA